MSDGGFITLHKQSLTSWLWDMPAPQTKVAITLLLMANWCDGEAFSGGRLVVVKRGQTMTSIDSIVAKSRSTRQTVRTSLSNLEKCGFLTCKSTNRFRMVTILNYDKFQSINQASQQASQQAANRPLTGRQHSEATAINTDITTKQPNKRTREADEAKSIAISACAAFSRFADRSFKASSKQMMKLASRLAKDGYTPDDVSAVIEAKAARWKNDAKMSEYLKPSTLLGPDNFPKYLEEDVGAPAPQVADASGRVAQLDLVEL